MDEALFKFHSGHMGRDGFLVYRATERRESTFLASVEETTFRVDLRSHELHLIEVEVVKYEDVPADVSWPTFTATEAIELRALRRLLDLAIYEKDRLDNPRPLLGVRTEAKLDGRPVRIIRHDGGSEVEVETRTVVDYDYDGDDEDGAPINRPIYERRTVPYDSLELAAGRSG